MMKNILLSVLFTLVAFTPVFAEGYTFTAPEEYDFIDWSVRLEADKAGGQIATGACRGPFYELGKNGKMIGEVGRICALGAIDTEGNSSQRALVGVLLAQVWGVGPTISYDPDNHDLAIGLGFSTMHWFKMFTDSTKTVSSPSITIPVSFAALAPDYKISP